MPTASPTVEAKLTTPSDSKNRTTNSTAAAVTWNHVNRSQRRLAATVSGDKLSSAKSLYSHAGSKGSLSLTGPNDFNSPVLDS